MHLNKPLLKVRNLNVLLDKNQVHQDLSFNLYEGEMLTILGPNGAGKSVLLKAILGIIPCSGSIDWSKQVKIGYLPQGFNQMAIKNIPFTVEDFFSLKNEIPSKSQIEKILSMVGLDPSFISRSAYALSGGQFQRLLIAWVLIDKPDVVFFDEPTTGIDLGGGETLYSLLNDLRKNKKLTVVLVTHDINIVYSYSDNVLCLGRRNHSCYGRPEKILSTEKLEEIFGMKIKYYLHK